MTPLPSDIEQLLAQFGSMSITQLLLAFEALTLADKMSQQIILGNYQDFQKKTRLGLLTQEQVQRQENQFRVDIYRLLQAATKPPFVSDALFYRFGSWMSQQGFTDETQHFSEEEWPYLGFKQSGHQPQIVATILADHLNKGQILEQREKFEETLQRVFASDRWTFARAPWALLLFWFDTPISNAMGQFIAKQSLAKGWLTHTYHLLCWSISEPNQLVMPHNNPIQVIPPIYIAHNPPAGLSPGKEAIEQWLEQSSS